MKQKKEANPKHPYKWQSTENLGNMFRDSISGQKGSLPLSKLLKTHVIVTEKRDGSNVSISYIPSTGKVEIHGRRFTLLDGVLNGTDLNYLITDHLDQIIMLYKLRGDENVKRLIVFGECYMGDSKSLNFKYGSPFWEVFGVKITFTNDTHHTLFLTPELISQFKECGLSIVPLITEGVLSEVIQEIHPRMIAGEFEGVFITNVDPIEKFRGCKYKVSKCDDRPKTWIAMETKVSEWKSSFVQSLKITAEELAVIAMVDEIHYSKPTGSKQKRTKTKEDYIFDSMKACVRSQVNINSELSKGGHPPVETIRTMVKKRKDCSYQCHR